MGATPKGGGQRLLVVTSTFPRSREDGEPGFVFELCRRLEGGYSVVVVAPHAPGSARREIMDGVSVRRFSYGPQRLEKLAYRGGILANLRRYRWAFLLVPCFAFAELRAVHGELRSQRVAAVHAHWLIPQGLIVLLARWLGGRSVPILVTSHGGDLFALRGGLFNQLKRAVLRRCDHVTVVSEAMLEEAVRIAGSLEHCTVIPMGVDLTRRFVPLAGSFRRREILFVGRLVAKKGVEILVEAFARIAVRYSGWRLTVVGDGPDRKGLERRVSELSLGGRVEFAGRVANAALPAYYQRAGFFVFPSLVAADGDREGFGLVAAEALGCECPVIAGDLPAVRDIIRDGETGLMVPPGNVEALAQAMKFYIENPEHAARLARRGRRHVVDRFDWGRIAARYAGLLESLA